MKYSKKLIPVMLSIQLAITSLTGSQSIFASEIDEVPKATLSNVTSEEKEDILIKREDTWKYHDQDADLGKEWIDSNFDDSAWLGGQSPLGYYSSSKDGVFDDIKLATPIYNAGKGKQVITTYYRKKINIDKSKYNTMIGNLHVDDGAIIYINGKEVTRYNMPQGDVNYKTNAESNLRSNESFYIPMEFINDGENTIAVEIHQRDENSSDVWFDFKLTGASVDDSIPDENFKYKAKTISLIPGENENELNFSWYGPNNMKTSRVEIAKKSDMVNGEFPLDKAKIFEGITQSYLNNQYGDFSSNQAIVTGLNENTEYVYRVGNDEFVSDVYEYSTEKSDKFNFIFTGDPQLGASTLSKDIEGWKNTVSKAINKFPDTSFIMQAGDQVNTATKEDEYDGLFAPKELTSIPLAPTVGNHDNAVNYKYHFNVPNEGEDLTKAGGDYYFVYGNTLFMVLNTNNASASEHKKFMERAIEETKNQDIKWTMAMFHQSIYSAASHRDSSSIVNLRNTMTPVFDELEVDIVLMGHDHCYVRTHQLLGGQPQLDQMVDEDGTVINPTGTLYLTANSSSGSKYYSLQSTPEEYSAVRNQNKLPTFLNVEVSDEEINITTYISSNLNEDGSEISKDAVLDSYSIAKVSGQDEVIVAINEIPLKITLNDKESIVNARKLYNSLGERAKELVTNIDKLVTAEEQLKKLEHEAEVSSSLVNKVIEAIENLPSNITLKESDLIKEVRNLYNNLSDVDKKLVNNINKLLVAEEELKKLEDEASTTDTANKLVQEVIEAIEKLPSNVNLKDKELIKYARDLYNKLSDDDKKLVTNIDKLVSLEKVISSIENKQESNQSQDLQSPQTGDNIGIYITIMAIALIILAILKFKKIS